MSEKKLEEALMKVALGYQLAEVTEEYSAVDGELKLTKRKKTKKDVPPDLKAVQLLLGADGEEYATLTDEELEEEKRRLLNALQAQEKPKKEGGRVATKKKKTVKKTTKKRTQN